MNQKIMELNRLKDVSGKKEKLLCKKCVKETNHEFTLGWNHDTRKYFLIYTCKCGEQKIIPIDYEKYREIYDMMKLPTSTKK